MNPIIQELEKPYLEKELPEMNPGDTVKVFVRIKNTVQVSTKQLR